MVPSLVDTPHLIQGRLLRDWRALMEAGQSRLGWKIGLNDPRAQRVYGLQRSVVGYMTGASLGEAREQFAATDVVTVEPEIALYLGRDVDARETPEQAASALAHAGPALEVLRMDQPRRTLAEVMGHNIFHRGVVLGHRGGADAAWAGSVRVLGGGRLLHQALHADALPPFGEIVALVAGTLGRHGERLSAGDVIISGSMTAPVPIRPGGAVCADFGGLGRVEAVREAGGRMQVVFGG